MTQRSSLDELQMLVHAWADERKLLSDSSPQAQMVKLAEEVGELAAGVCRDDRQRIIDSIGDTTVVLIVMCGVLGVSFRDCLQAAYDEIKGRSGTTEGGVFRKAADAKVARFAVGGDAVARAVALMTTPMSQVPPLAIGYARHLAASLGMSGEVYLTAFAAYAQCAEGLECSDDAYAATPEARRWFASKQGGAA